MSVAAPRQDDFEPLTAAFAPSSVLEGAVEKRSVAAPIRPKTGAVPDATRRCGWRAIAGHILWWGRPLTESVRMYILSLAATFSPNQPGCCRSRPPHGRHLLSLHERFVAPFPPHRQGFGLGDPLRGSCRYTNLARHPSAQDEVCQRRFVILRVANRSCMTSALNARFVPGFDLPISH